MKNYWLLSCIGAVSLFITCAHAAQQSAPLPPEQAFAVAVEKTGENSLDVRFRIVQGYYLYRQRFDFSLKGDKTSPQAISPIYPHGQQHRDDFFGESEIYRGDLSIVLPLKSWPAKDERATLLINYQGCADMGICYPPQRYEVALNRHAANGVLSGLTNPLMSDKAPTANMSSVSDGGQFSSSKAAVDQPDPFASPAANGEKNKGEKKTALEERSTNALKNTLANKPVPIVANAVMAQTERDGLKAQPANNPTPTVIPPLPGETLVAQAAQQGAVGGTLAFESGTDEVSQIANALQNKSPWLSLTLFLLSGLLLAFTPCVLPMVPILSSIIVGQGKNISRRRAILWSSYYVLGMALVFALIGLLAGVLGTWLTAWLQKPVVLVAFALIYVALALSLFGLFNLALPDRLRKAASPRPTSGGRVFLMGALSALVVGPCLTPPLAGAILFIAQSHHSWFGASALFLLAVGMGIPVLLAAVASHAILPKPGVWMVKVQYFFGWLLLGLAWWTVTPILGSAFVLVGWGILFAVLAIFLHALDSLPEDAPPFLRCAKALGVVSLVYAIVLLVGAAMGNREVLRPLGNLASVSTNHIMSTTPEFYTVKDEADLATQIANTDKLVMVDFYADWCASCKELETFTFSDPAVMGYLQQMKLLRVDITKGTPADYALLKRYGVIAPPTLLFFDRQGNPLPDHRVVGYQNAKKFLTTVQQLLRT